jgi:serine/threonine-protein kinase RsbW
MASKTPISRSAAVGSIPTAITEVCRKILSELKEGDFSQEDIFAVHLAMEEAFINAISHGNEMNSDKKVKIDYSVGLDKVEIFMMDEGNGFDPNLIPDPRSGENLYKTEGRGLLLINSYMDVVEFNEQGNRVHMVRYKEKPRLTETHSSAQA